jgi:hypothetical protein
MVKGVIFSEKKFASIKIGNPSCLTSREFKKEL